jgi:ADP-ribose pyrophosphatase YjhB (NUDIX family)
MRYSNMPTTLATLENLLLRIGYNLAVQLRCLLRWCLKHRDPGVRALVIQGDNIILVKHRGGPYPWGLPGGGVRPGESLDVAIVREVFEETGCAVQIERVHGVFYARHWCFESAIVVFVCTTDTAPNAPRHDIEIETAKAFPLTALPMDTDVGTRCNVAEYLCGEWQIVDLEPKPRR